MPDPDPTQRVVVIVVFDGVKLLDAAGPARVLPKPTDPGRHTGSRSHRSTAAMSPPRSGRDSAVTDRIASIESADTFLVAWR